MRTILMIRTFPHTITFVFLTFLRRTGVNPDAVSLCATHPLSLSPLSSRVAFWALMATAIANGGGVARHFAHHASRQRSSSQESLVARRADAHGVADGRFVTVLDFGTPSAVSRLPGYGYGCAQFTYLLENGSIHGKSIQDSRIKDFTSPTTSHFSP